MNLYATFLEGSNGLNGESRVDSLKNSQSKSLIFILIVDIHYNFFRSEYRLVYLLFFI